MKWLKKLTLTHWIFIALVVGILIGNFFPEFGKSLSPISNVFLRLIKSIVALLLFGTIVSGIVSGGELKIMGRIALKSITYFEIATTLALVIGLVVVNLMQPGVGLTLQAGASSGIPANLAKPASFGEILEHAVPANIFDALARNDVLQMVIFFFLFGAACAAIGDRAKPVVEFAGAVAEVMFRYTKYVMYLAPFGVGAAIAVTVGQNGLGVLKNLGKLVGSLYLAQGLFVVLVLGSALTIARVPIGALPGPSASPSCWRSPPPRARPHCRWRSKTWNDSAFPSTSSASCCPPATASISMARHFTWRWRPSLWPRQRASTCR